MKKTNSFLIAIIILALLLSGLIAFQKNDQIEVKARVLKTDNSDMIQSGVANIGNQTLEVEILEGKHQGEILTAYNELTGELQLDNYFQVNDKIIVAIQESNNQLVAKAIGLYRLNWELLLFFIFILLLILYAGKVGLKALFSFIVSLYIIWNFLILSLLAGQQPLILSTIILLLLSAIIIFSVAGFNKKGLAAFLGTITGLFAKTVITMIFGDLLYLKGMTAPFAEALLYSRHLNLNIKHIFYATVAISASMAEILRTITGSIGLVLVAPITAFLAGWIYCTEFSID